MTKPRSPEEWLRLAEEQAARSSATAGDEQVLEVPQDDVSSEPATSDQPHGPGPSRTREASSRRRVPAPPTTPPRPPARARPPEADRGAWARPRRVVEASDATVTKVLVGAMVLVFLYEQTLSGNAAGAFRADWALWGPAVDDGRWWQLLTPALLHANLMHIGFNAYLLWALGGQLELGTGHLRFALVFVGSVLGGSLGSLLLQPDAAAIGASGGVFGLFGFFAVRLLVRGQNPMQSQIGPLILLNLVFTFAVPGIAIGGHIGGLFAGGLLGGVLTWADDRDQRTLGLVAAAAATLAMAVGGIGVA